MLWRALLLLAVTAASAHAQGSDVDRARALFERGVDAYDREDFAEALDLFEQSWEARRSQLVLFNIAVTERRLGQDAAALLHLREWVERYGESEPGRREQAETAISELRPGLSLLRVVTTPPAASVAIDGAPAQTTEAGWTVLTPGMHTVEVDAEGHEPDQQQLELQAGAERVVRVSLSAIEAEPGPRAPPPPPPEDDDGGWTFAWIAASGTIVFAGLAVGFWLAGDAAFDDLEMLCGATGCSEAQIDDSSVRTWDILTNVAMFTAIAAGAATVLLFLLEGGGDGEEPTTTVGVGPTGATLRHSF